MLLIGYTKFTIVLDPSSNFFKIKEHVNCVNNLDEFADMSPMNKLLYEGELDLGQYKRYMRIGYK